MSATGVCPTRSANSQIPGTDYGGASWGAPNCFWNAEGAASDTGMYNPKVGLVVPAQRVIEKCP